MTHDPIAAIARGPCECEMIRPTWCTIPRKVCGAPGVLIEVEGQLLIARVIACRYHRHRFRHRGFVVRMIGLGVTLAKKN